MVPAGNKTKCLSSVNHTTKTIHHHHHHSELFWSAFSRIQTVYGEMRSISPYSVQNRENADQNNSEYGHFLRSVYCLQNICEKQPFIGVLVKRCFEIRF